MKKEAKEADFNFDFRDRAQLFIVKHFVYCQYCKREFKTRDR